jgi:hypothetical protein
MENLKKMTYDLSTEDPRFTAALDMIGRTGARSFQIRFQDDEEPTVWIAVAQYGVNKYDVPIPKGGKDVYKVAAALHPVVAVLNLLDATIDGGQCTHCKRPAGVTLEIEPMPLQGQICWYQFDPELKTFRRGCE